MQHECICLHMVSELHWRLQLPKWSFKSSPLYNIWICSVDMVQFILPHFSDNTVIEECISEKMEEPDWQLSGMASQQPSSRKRRWWCTSLRHHLQPFIIHGENTEMVQSFESLAVHHRNKLVLEVNVDSVCWSMFYLLKELKSFRLSRNPLHTF